MMQRSYRLIMSCRIGTSAAFFGSLGATTGARQTSCAAGWFHASPGTVACSLPPPLQRYLISIACVQKVRFAALTPALPYSSGVGALYEQVILPSHFFRTSDVRFPLV